MQVEDSVGGQPDGQQPRGKVGQVAIGSDRRAGEPLPVRRPCYLCGVSIDGIGDYLAIQPFGIKDVESYAVLVVSCLGPQIGIKGREDELRVHHVDVLDAVWSQVVQECAVVVVVTHHRVTGLVHAEADVPLPESAEGLQYAAVDAYLCLVDNSLAVYGYS